MNVSNLDNIKQRICPTGWEVEGKKKFEKRGKIVYILTLENEGSVICAEIRNRALNISFEAPVMIKEKCENNGIS